MKFFNKKSRDAKGLRIVCEVNSIKIEGREISFPLHLNTLIEILGKPSRQEHDLIWHVAWDDWGLYTSYGTWDNIFRIYLLVSMHHKKSYTPKQFFNGKLLVNEQEIQHTDFGKRDLTQVIIQQLTYKGEEKPYAIAICKNFDYKEEIPKDKYVIGQPEEEPIVFQDFGFKLSVIQELMYNKELLTPKFDLYEFVEWYDKRTIDIEKEGYDPIPEVTQYFKDLPVPKSLAKEITEIYQDGGNKIYLNLLRFGEGWEDYWDIETVVDAQQFPNLKTATLVYAKEYVIEELLAMGIEAKFL